MFLLKQKQIRLISGHTFQILKVQLIVISHLYNMFFVVRGGWQKEIFNRSDIILKTIHNFLTEIQSFVPSVSHMKFVTYFIP